jgi:hypothetical protein
VAQGEPSGAAHRGDRSYGSLALRRKHNRLARPPRHFTLAFTAAPNSVSHWWSTLTEIPTMTAVRSDPRGGGEQVIPLIVAQSDGCRGAILDDVIGISRSDYWKDAGRMAEQPS